MKKITAIKTKRGKSKLQIKGTKPRKYSVIISLVDNPDRTKSSVFSLVSTATATIVNNNRQKKKVIMSFLNMYQSIFFIQ